VRVFELRISMVAGKGDDAVELSFLVVDNDAVVLSFLAAPGEATYDRPTPMHTKAGTLPCQR